MKNKNSQKGYRKILKDTLNKITNDEILEVLKKRVEGIEFNNLADFSNNDEVNLPDFIHIEEVRKFLEE
tara:strand:- start:229 stop:435 length:207 start_codon:yes stop_codon:yes gene_type:complete